MSRATKIVVLALLLVLIVAICASYFVPAKHDSIAESGSRAIASAPVAPISELDQDQARKPQPREIRADAEHSTSPKPSDQEQPSFSGWFEFADGSQPPEMNFEIIAEPLPADASIADLVAESERSDAAKTCRHWAAFRTEADSRFRIERLFPGRYRIRLTSFSGLGQIDGTYVVPAKDIALQLPGYLLRVRTVGDDEQVLSGALVVCEYSMDSRSDPADGPLHLSLTSDATGNAVFCVPEAGECTLRATSGSKASAPQLVTTRGPSFQSVSTLVLRAGAEASLRVSIHGCDARAEAVTNYCIRFQDERGLATVFRLCSETAEQPGVFRHLPPGRYLAEAVPSYSASAVFYSTDAPLKQTPVVLVDNQVSDLDFCVELGGRISVIVTAESASSPETRYDAKVELGEPNTIQPKSLSFREPTATGVRFSMSLPFDTSRMAESVIRPGSYDLIISAEGFESVRRPVNVYANQITEVRCELARKS